MNANPTISRHSRLARFDGSKKGHTGFSLDTWARNPCLPVMLRQFARQLGLLIDLSASLKPRYG